MFLVICLSFLCWITRCAKVIEDENLYCRASTPCTNEAWLTPYTTQYIYCYECQNATFFIPSHVNFCQILIYEHDDSSPVNNISIYSSGDYLRVAATEHSKLSNANIYIGSIYNYLPDWFESIGNYSDYNSEDDWEPLTYNRAAGLWIYSNQHGTKDNINIICNGSVDGCHIGTLGDGAGTNGINDVTMYCSITESYNKTTTYTSDTEQETVYSPQQPKCLFYCAEQGDCVSGKISCRMDDQIQSHFCNCTTPADATNACDNILITGPTVSPSEIPSVLPTFYPSSDPTIEPSIYPTSYPTIEPSIYPSSYPTIATLILEPSNYPSKYPLFYSSMFPSEIPSMIPSHIVIETWGHPDKSNDSLIFMVISGVLGVLLLIMICLFIRYKLRTSDHSNAGNFMSRILSVGSTATVTQDVEDIADKNGQIDKDNQTDQKVDGDLNSTIITNRNINQNTDKHQTIEGQPDGEVY